MPAKPSSCACGPTVGGLEVSVTPTPRQVLAAAGRQARRRRRMRGCRAAAAAAAGRHSASQLIQPAQLTQERTAATWQHAQPPAWIYTILLYSPGWLGSRVVSVLDSGAEAPGFKSQPRCCRVTVLGKLFTPIVPMFTNQRNW